MSKHLIITAITLFFVVILVVAMWGTVDTATRGSADPLLAEHSLPADLPTVHQPSGGGDAASDYRRAIDLYIEHYDGLRSSDPPKKQVDKLVQLIRSAADKGSCSFGFADQYVPMEPGARSEYKSAPGKIANLILNQAEKMPEQRGKQTMLAVWTFGHRLYDRNLRIIPRQAGLGMMQLTSIYYDTRYGEDAPKAQAMAKWIPHLDKITKAWDEKLKAIYTYNASVGDLVRIAESDHDKSFRVEALLQMGIAQWTTNVRANVSAVKGTLEDHAAGEDADLARAARAAQQFTRENVRMIN